MLSTCEELYAILFSDEMKLLVVRDFDPKKMNAAQKMELKYILKSRRSAKRRKEIKRNNILKEERLTLFAKVTKEICDEYLLTLDQNERQEITNAGFQTKYHRDLQHDSKICDWIDSEELKALLLPKQANQIYSGGTLMTVDIKGCCIRKDSTDIRNQVKIIKMDEPMTIMRTNLVNEQHLPSTRSSHDGAVYPDGGESEQDDQPTLSDSDDSSNDKDYLSKNTLMIKRSDELVTIPPTNIG